MNMAGPSDWRGFCLSFIANCRILRHFFQKPVKHAGMKSVREAVVHIKRYRHFYPAAFLENLAGRNSWNRVIFRKRFGVLQSGERDPRNCGEIYKL